METALRHTHDLTLPFDEFRVWSHLLRPQLEEAGTGSEAIAVLEYVCTEMLNNVVAHSRASHAQVAIDWNQQSVVMRIDDDGSGIFSSVSSAFALESDADAAILLTKGKVTTDPARHTGEGLFFSARACDWFCVQSGKTALVLGSAADLDARNWVLETPNESVQGTRLRFNVSQLSAPHLKDIFDAFCPQPELQFNRTVVSVGLLRQADLSLVSRSQGKRLVLGLEKFSNVVFDFQGVEAIQQGFADEVFRVWRNANPHVSVSVVHASDDVARMLKRVGAGDVV
jgi:anti-sigma regulatory factor (Ser/Thr protein kinase)